MVIAAFASAVEKELRFPSAGPVLKSIHEQMKRWAVIFQSPLGQIVGTVIGAGQSEPEILDAFRAHWVEPRRVEARNLLRQAIKNDEVRSDLDPDLMLDLFYGPLYLRLVLKHAPLDEGFVNTDIRSCELYRSPFLSITRLKSYRTGQVWELYFVTLSGEEHESTTALEIPSS